MGSWFLKFEKLSQNMWWPLISVSRSILGSYWHYTFMKKPTKLPFEAHFEVIFSQSHFFPTTLYLKCKCTLTSIGCIHLLNTRKYCDNTCKYCGNTHEYWANTWKMWSPAIAILASIVTILVSFEAILMLKLVVDHYFEIDF